MPPRACIPTHSPPLPPRGAPFCLRFAVTAPG
jgi:hypothetical protein